MTTAQARDDASDFWKAAGETAVREFVSAPEEFLRSNVVLLRMADGMRARSPEPAMDHAAFLHWMDKQDRHWFTLARHPAATTADADRAVYVLTPAVEKYAQAYGIDPSLSALITGRALPEVGTAETYIQAHYIPYLRGRTSNPEQNVGHTTVPVAPSVDFRADFVFTAAMNGCALAITKEDGRDDFTAWHYQSPSSNREESERFRVEAKPVDWFGDAEYQSLGPSSIPESTNLLWRGSQGWEFIGQENHASFDDYDNVRTNAVTSRPVRLEPGQEWRYVARHYLRSVEDRLEKLRRVEATHVRRLGVSAPDMLLKSSFSMVKMQAERDKEALSEVGGAHQLAEAARKMETGHGSTREIVAKFDEQRLSAEREVAVGARFWRRNPQNAGQALREQVGRFTADLGGDAWTTGLRREARSLAARHTSPPTQAAWAAVPPAISAAARLQANGTPTTHTPPTFPTPWTDGLAPARRSSAVGQ
ncbi:hypothetical protein [Streptomyces sp. NBC_00343]|uniref:hypothetical protein n=1 Tax=Streptomyces sp. NBC_00343 TaxID=2975719 RepID=UPI002E29376C|nr:hypothetical protein [Streptomyces sp. NBC_00343]